MNQLHRARRQRGVTLMELMIVVAIISMVAAFAYPSYTQFVTRSKRTAATATLMQVADRQQQYFMDNKRYAASLTSLGYATDTIMIDEEGQIVTAGSDDRVYNVSISASNFVTYELTAAPQLTQAKKDTDCANLTLDHNGVRGYSGSGGNCW